MDKKLVKTSKFLSLILRHSPATIGIKLDPQGWVAIDELIRAAAQSGRAISRSLLDEVVLTNDKQRFAYSADGRKIRANQGHSVSSVDLGLAPKTPPEFLYHGTIAQFMNSIRKSGLQKMQRRYVHLSPDTATAIIVGKRRGKPVILTVQSGKMYDAGLQFFLSENGVWLTESVSWTYIAEVRYNLALQQ